jgi:hypothetical protein
VIEPPRRAVTRFFLPMIDVLILLVGIFLLMPFVSDPEPAPSATAAATELERVKNDFALAERRLEEFKRQRRNPLENTRVAILQIDARTGRLYDFRSTSDGVKEIATAADAERFIAHEHERAGAQEICFLILYPQDLSGFPVRDQIERYRQWFRNEPHAFDKPWSAP